MKIASGSIFTGGWVSVIVFKPGQTRCLATNEHTGKYKMGRLSVALMSLLLFASVQGEPLCFYGVSPYSKISLYCVQPVLMEKRETTDVLQCVFCVPSFSDTFHKGLYWLKQQRSLPKECRFSTNCSCGTKLFSTQPSRQQPTGLAALSGWCEGNIGARWINGYVVAEKRVVPPE